MFNRAFFAGRVRRDESRTFPPRVEKPAKKLAIIKGDKKRIYYGEYKRDGGHPAAPGSGDWPSANSTK
jgi:hypothetical protein